MKKRKYPDFLYHLLTPVFCLIILTSHAKFDFNPTCQQAMQAILDLRFEDARLLIEGERTTNPDNGYIIYLEHYREAIELIITEDPAVYRHLIDSCEDRLERMDQLDDGSPDNEWLQAEILFHTGLAQVRFGTRVSGASKIFSSYRRIRDHRQEYPDFWQNQKLTGMYNIMFDFIPPFMRWAADMFGFSGNADMGTYQLERYFEEASLIPGLAEEAALVAGLGYKMMQQEKNSFVFFEGLEKTLLDITLVKYTFATAATYVYRNDLALRLLGEIHREDLQVNFYSLDYLTGRCQLNHLEPDANIYLEKYLSDYPGSDYKKDICNRLSYHYLLRGDVEKFREYQARVALVGSDLRERDQEAVIESRSEIIPREELLKARLLCDGGYFEEARAVLIPVNPSQLQEIAYRLEYHYRMGRILQLSGQEKEAIPELSRCYDEGKSHPFTFATRAALNLGKIYEEHNDPRSAFQWYQLCIDTYSAEHTTAGVKVSAEKGIKRVKGTF